MSRMTRIILAVLGLLALASTHATASPVLAVTAATAVTAAAAPAVPAAGRSPAAQATAPVPEIVRVGGVYTVTAIDRQGDHGFLVQFKAEHPTGKFDVLRLESDHVHVAVKIGQKLRLSAEILSQRGSTADVAQMVIFFPGATGRIPVWMLSTKAPNRELRATKYLEMHVPMTDYQVM